MRVLRAGTRRVLQYALAIGICVPALAAEVFREPFDLRLPIDSERYYEEHFAPVPFVHDGTVYLFKGERVGVRVGGSAGLAYEPDASKADLVFELDQRPDDKGGLMMVLTIRNRTSRGVTMEAMMTVPGETRIFNTSVLPVGAGRTNYESWPPSDRPVSAAICQNAVSAIPDAKHQGCPWKWSGAMPNPSFQRTASPPLN